MSTNDSGAVAGSDAGRMNRNRDRCIHFVISAEPAGGRLLGSCPSFQLSRSRLIAAGAIGVRFGIDQHNRTPHSRKSRTESAIVRMNSFSSRSGGLAHIKPGSAPQHVEVIAAVDGSGAPPRMYLQRARA